MRRVYSTMLRLPLGYLSQCVEFILTFNLCLTKQDPNSLGYWHRLLTDAFETLGANARCQNK